MNIAATAVNLFLDASPLGSSSILGAIAGGGLVSSLLGSANAPQQPSVDPLAGIISQFAGGAASLLGSAASIAGILA